MSAQDAKTVRDALNFYAINEDHALALAALDRLLADLAAARAREQRLRDVRNTIQERWRFHLDEASESDDDGSHVGIARYHRTRAEGLGDALNLLTAALAAEPAATLAEPGRRDATVPAVVSGDASLPGSASAAADEPGEQ